jgi:hypothetical protein
MPAASAAVEVDAAAADAAAAQALGGDLQVAAAATTTGERIAASCRHACPALGDAYAGRSTRCVHCETQPCGCNIACCNTVQHGRL